MYPSGLGPETSTCSARNKRHTAIYIYIYIYTDVCVYTHNYLAHGSAQVANGSVRMLTFAGQFQQRRKSISPGQHHGKSKRTRPYAVI